MQQRHLKIMWRFRDKDYWG